MDDFTELLKSIGTPAGMLAALVYFLSRAGKFLGPMVEKLFTAHVGMVGSLQQAVEKTQPMLTEQHGMITDIHEEVVSKKSKPAATRVVTEPLPPRSLTTPMP